MTITIRSETGSFGTTNATTGVFTVPKPSVEDNDYVVVVIGKQDEPNVSPPTGTGWVIGNQLGSATGNDRWGGIYYKKVTGSSEEPATYTFDSAGVSEAYGCWSMALSGVDQSTPEDVSFGGDGAWAALSNNQTPNAPAVTVVSDGAMAFACWAVNAATGTMPGGSWNTRVSNLNNGALFLASQTFAASGTSTGAPEIALVNATQESMVGMFVFRPAITEYPGTFTLDLNKGITASSIVSGIVSESLPLTQALTTTSAWSGSDSFSLPVSKDLQASAQKVITASLELSSELGLGASPVTSISDIILSASNTFSGNINLDKISGLSSNGQLSNTGSITLANTLALQFSSSIPTTEDVILSLSDFISESGTVPTTAQLTPPSGKSIADFTAGLISDDINPLLIDIANNQYTEIEWSIEFTSGVQYDDQYEFRITVTGSALDSYLQTPKLTVFAGGNIYTGTLSLDEILSFTDTSQLIGIGNITLDKTLGVTESSNLVGIGTFSLDKNVDFTDFSQLTAIGTIGLGDVLGVSNATQLSGTSSLSLNKILTFTDTSQLDAIASLDLSKILALIQSGGLQVAGSILLDKILALSSSGFLTTSANIELSYLLGLSELSQLSSANSISLDKILSLTDASQFDGIGNINLGSLLGFNTFRTSAVFGSISLDKSVSLDEFSQLDAVASIGLSEFLALANSGLYSGSASLSLGEAIGITTTSSATFIGTFSLGLNLALDTSGVVGAHLYVANIALDKNLGLSETSQLDAVGTLTLTRVITLADGSIQTAYVTADLGKALGITLNANGIYGLTFVLPESLLLSLNSLVIPFGGMPTIPEGSLIISDTLYYTLNIWDENVPKLEDEEAKEIVIWDV